MKLRIGKLKFVIGYEAVAAMTAVLILDRENYVICCFLAAMLHEMGHILMMLLFKVRIREIDLRLFDILIRGDEPNSLRADIFITLGGIMMNLISAVIFLPISVKLSLPNIALAVFNILPVMSLDGGHLLYILLSRRFDIRFCDNALRLTTFIFILPFMTAGIYILINSGYNYSLLAISLYLLTVLFIRK